MNHFLLSSMHLQAHLPCSMVIAILLLFEESAIGKSAHEI